MTTSAVTAPVAPAPEPGQLVRVRDRNWVVAEVSRSAHGNDLLDSTNGFEHLVTLTSVEDDRYDESIRVLWELEPGATVRVRATLPTPDPDHLDDPNRLGAFLDAVRWGAVTSADSTALQAPFRSGITIEDYQLDPVVRAVRLPRVNLLIADDVGLGKTIEAGLVVQELMLRHRARTMLVVCPASLCVKWRDEMAEKFGLEFRIVDTEALRELRRNRGLRANPWTHFPRLITSIDWLKRDRPMRLMRDVLPPMATYPRRFDLLIVDEVHNMAPSGRGRYATDSQRTTALRELAPHFEHRLFLSATPHNGYRESFTALLELLDPQRFARGVDPNARHLRDIMVRRLKSELPPLLDGTPRFPRREIIPIEVAYPPAEREAHRLLESYVKARRKAVADETGRMAVEFSLKLLKKRLFSSPAAFARTLAVHSETVERARPASRTSAPTLRVLSAALARADEEASDETDAAQAIHAALAAAAASAAAAPAAAPLSGDERALLAKLRAWAASAETHPDAKASALLAFLDDVVRPVGSDGIRRWSDQRVIVFTEYRDTQRWLVDLLSAHGLGEDRLALLYGGMDETERERVKAVFQADPSLDPVRILLATDAASEGIDLQLHCHRLVHYEIPWNPNRLEQRNGRVDRHGQLAGAVLIHHFVGAGYETAASGSLEDDLEFLRLVAVKVDQIREDLGSAGEVISRQVEERMLGNRTGGLDEAEIGRAVPRGRLASISRDLRTQIARLGEQLTQSVAELHLSAAAVCRVVQVALSLAHQPALIPVTVDRPILVKPGEHHQCDQEGTASVAAWRLPRLTGSWARAAEGLAHPVTGDIRPITFDHDVAAGHDDIVLAHLGHRLVTQAMWLLRSEIWAIGGDGRLARVSARVIPDAIAKEVVAVVHGRLVITGADGRRLHEEVVASAGLVRNGRFSRLTTLAQVQAVLDAPNLGVPEREVARQVLNPWAAIADGLETALNRRCQERSDALAGVLSRRADEEVATLSAVLSELEGSIRRRLDEASKEHQMVLPGFEPVERAQLEADLEALRNRLDRIPAEIEAETAAIRRRYASPTPRVFPAAVELCIPERLTAHQRTGAAHP